MIFNLLKWINIDGLKSYSPSCFNLSDDINEMSPETRKTAYNRFEIVANILPFVGDKTRRNAIITELCNKRNISRQTVCKYLWLYLVYQDVSALAPKEKEVKRELTVDEKNIRWALNKFYYTRNKNTLTTAYTLMLKEKYCNVAGQLLEHYPTFNQFRYFYRKHKKLETYYISRNGLTNYQRNNRPLLGDGGQEYAPTIGTSMLDSTILDVFLVNSSGNIVGRPILSVCIDAYSGMCLGYSLTWEGGTYSLRNLMLNVIADKAKLCKKNGIKINKEDWNCSSVLPLKLVTDMGKEYVGETFTQLSDLGITIENLPPYRPELKGTVEKFFDIIQNLYKPHLKGKGVIEPDFQERGTHDYRKDACLTMDDFEKIILNCIVYYNTKRIISNFPYSEDMISNEIKPYANSIWNYRYSQYSNNLIKTDSTTLILTLLPRTKAKFTRRGLIVNKLRYKNDDYTEMYLSGGNATVAYNPDDVTNAIYLANNTDDTEQSFVIADPLYTSMYCYGEMKWSKVSSPYGRLVLNKTDGMGNALPGAIFELVGTDGSKFEGTSNEDGLIIWEYLNPDIQYTLTETQAPEGFLTAEPMTVSVPAGQTQTVNVSNKSARTLRVVKIDAQDGSPIIGATFRFEQIDGSYKTDITTTHSGVIELEGNTLPYGTYKVYELKAPAGYQEDKEPQTVEWKGTEDITLTFENVRKPSLRIVKMDKDTHDPLEDVSFKVYKDGELVTTVTTDNAGYARASGLTEGYYEVEEVAAPEGYVLDTTRHGIHIDPYNPATENDPVLVITNEKKPGLVIEKLDSKTLEPMEGTTFAVYKDTVLIGEYQTDRYGLIELTDLEPGTYTVKEVKTDNFHVLQGCPQYIELVAGKEARLIFFNKEKPGISILKIDAETKKPLSNAVFKVKMVDGSYEKEYTTDKNGEIELTDLEPGVYTVTETTAPDGYVIDTETRTFEAVADGSVSLVFTNSKKPSLTVLKYDAYKDKYLAGATFRIAKIEDGSNYLDRVTDTNGAIRIDNLLPGVYSVKEIEAPSGYVLNDTEYHVELFGGKESQLVVINEEKPSLKIEKTDAITGEPIQGVGFLVKHAEGSTENTVVTDENGVAVLEHLTPGIYEVTEKSVPNGYLLDTEPKLVTLEPNRTSVVRFKNYPKPSLTINKVDEITKDALKGAKFSIIYASNNTFTGEINDMGTYQKLYILRVKNRMQ